MATLTPTIRVVDADGQPVTGDAPNLTLSVIADGVATAYSGDITEVDDGEYSVVVTQAGTLQSVSGASSTSGAIVIPARWQNFPAADPLLNAVPGDYAEGSAGYALGRIDDIETAVYGISGGSGAHAITLYVKDEDGNPVGSCPVRVSNSGGQLLGYSRSNASTGQVTFNLDAGEYIVTLGPLANYAPNNPHTLTVAGGTTADLTVTAISLPTPADPGLCVVYADMRNAVGGQLLGAGEGSLNVIHVVSRPTGSTEVLADDGDNDAPALTDGSGRAALSIVRGAVVWIRATWPDGHTKTVQVTVPDEDAYDVGADL